MKFIDPLERDLSKLATASLRQISWGRRLAFLPVMMALLSHTALAEALDVYRYENRLIIVSLPQTAHVEKVSAMLAWNREKIEERHLKIIDVSEGEQKIPNAVRLNPSQTESVRKQLRIARVTRFQHLF